ncbi:MAG TPA: M3 family metallopeptidase [Microlunatus sp.]|nr:M3 family metallopeptidase [Microlunatus sp.]
MSNPFFVASDLPFQLPPFASITIEHFRPALDAGMAEQLAEVEVIAHRDTPATFANTVVALERSGRTLDRVRRVFWCLTSADTNPELQAIETEYAPRLSAHADAITLDRALFARIDELHAHRDELGLDAESAKLLDRYHLDFVRAGAALDEADQNRLRELNAELATLSAEFGVRLLAAAKGSAVHVTDAAELDGLSDDAIAAAAETAKGRGLDGYLIELVLPTHQPVLTSLRHRGLRRRVLDASVGRGSDPDTDTSDVVRRMVVARARRAVLLGYLTHSDYVLADRTVGSNARLDATLQQLIPAAVENAHRDQARLVEALAADTGDDDFGPHDWAYYAERVDAAGHGGEGAGPDAAILRPHFELTRTVEEGVFGAAGAVYGLTFRRRADLVGYHPDVVIYEVLDEADVPVGLFLGDFYTRPGKQGGAWMESLVAQSRLLEQLPVVVNNLNLAKPPAGQPTLLGMDEIGTLFHEFGHALHGLLSSVTYPRLAGTAVSKDFVEYPSQVNEMWGTDPQLLARYARHIESGEPLSAEQVAALQVEGGSDQARETVSFLAATWLDLAWHRLTEAEVDEAVRDIDAFEARVLGEVGLDLATIPPRYRSRYFNHIFSSGYAAGYYSYLWSEILDADTVEWFTAHRDRLREAGDVFRAELLSRGGSGDEMSYFEAFRGRPPRIEPLLRRRGLLTG